MGFTVRFMLGTLLVLLCFWSAQTTQLNRFIRQVSHNESQTPDKLPEIQAESSTQKIVANLTDTTKPKTDFSTDNKTIDKTNSVISNPEKAETVEIARSIDIEKYVSKEFHNKNNVFTLPTSSDNEKFVNPEFDYHVTTHKHEFEYDYHSELTTPKSPIFDDRFKEAVASVDQKLEHFDDSPEVSSELESKERPSFEKLLEETKRNDTKADLNYVNYKNVVSNDTAGKHSMHQDVVVEEGTNLDFHSNYNHTSVIDEDDNGNNTIAKENDKKIEVTTLSNVIPDKGDLERAESSTSKSVILTTRKNNILTKPPSNRNSSHISILSNNIETETVKAINPVQSSTDRNKGETETVQDLHLNKTPIVLAKRPFMVAEEPRTEPVMDTNHINKSEQLLQENQVIPVHVEAPPTMKNSTTESPSRENETTEEVVSTTTNLPSTTSAVETTTTVVVATIAPAVERTTRVIATTTPVVETTPTLVVATTTVPTNLADLVKNATKQPETTEIETITSVVTETSVSPWTKLTTMTPVEVKTFPTISTKLMKVLPVEVTPTESTTEVPFSTTETETKLTTEVPIEVKTFPTPEITTQLPTEVPFSTTARGEFTTPLIESEGTTVASTETQTTVESISTTVEATTAIESTPSTIEFEQVSLTEIPLNTNTEIDLSNKTTTENSVRTSKEMVYKDVTTSPVVTEAPLSTTEPTTLQTTEVLVETTQTKTEEPETTSVPATVNHSTRVAPEFKSIEQTDSSVEVENSTENYSATSEFYENTNSPDSSDNSGTIAAIAISSVGAVCLILLAGLLVIMRKRQKRFNYGQRCRPVSLDDYSMDNVSVYNSVRRKGAVRGSKRSYGNPAFEDPVCVSHPLNFPALGKFANNLEDMKAEFEEIPQITARTNELPEGCDTKNRYANVIPLPETRVFLSLIDGYPNSDYINANYVTGPKNTKGYYIACQAPLQNTVDDFWRMIWEQQCKVVLMLTHLFENGVEKCVDYLPPSEVLDCHRLFGDFQVTLKKREVKDKYIISSLQLKNMVSNSWREVTHFWYLGWPEKGVPSEANSLIAFLIEARSYMKSSSLDRKEVTNGNLTNGLAKNELNPVVVHCSPGTGRTGVVIACDIAIREFEQTRLIDVPRIVYKIRRDRASAVQTKEQYAFIYKVINFYATKLTGGALDSL